MPYSTLCQACRVKYNFIAKYETFEQDMKYLQSSLNINYQNLKTRNSFSTGISGSSYREEFSQLPSDIICSLMKHYEEDLVYFDYRVEDYLPSSRKITC